jgi:hypothetical protein
MKIFAAAEGLPASSFVFSMARFPLPFFMCTKSHHKQSLPAIGEAIPLHSTVDSGEWRCIRRRPDARRLPRRLLQGKSLLAMTMFFCRLGCAQPNPTMPSHHFHQILIEHQTLIPTQRG